MSRSPAGFKVLAVCAALFTAATALGLASARDEPLVSAILSVWGALALVAAEALWRARPWAYRATAALAAAVLGVTGIVGVTFCADADFGGLFFLAITALGGYGLHPVVTYVRDRSRSLRAAHAAAP